MGFLLWFGFRVLWCWLFVLRLLVLIAVWLLFCCVVNSGGIDCVLIVAYGW